METLHIVKIGGNVIDNEELFDEFIKKFAVIRSPKILVHGGGKMATSVASALGIEQIMIEGRRITDVKTLGVTVMVYAGLINKKIVAALQSKNVNAMGFCGADGNLIRSTKRQHPEIDFGCVGDVNMESVNGSLLHELINKGIIPVFSAITHDGIGNLLNTNADSIARVLALAMKDVFNVVLSYCFEKKGVMMNVDDENSLISRLTRNEYNDLKANGIISKGMIPKLENAFMAVESGIKDLVICHARNIDQIESSGAGTRLAIS